MSAHLQPNIPGDRFGRLTLVREAPRSTHARKWVTVCDCGKEQIAWQQNLRAGRTVACANCCDGLRVLHGMSATPLYVVWQQMRARCYSDKAKGYSYCGAQGIRVCEEWTDFRVFREWALASGYAPGLWLQRIDKSKDYAPDNCMFATPATSVRNRRGMKLTVDDVRDIVAKKQAGTPAKALASEYQIGVNHVHSIINGNRWGNI